MKFTVYVVVGSNYEHGEGEKEVMYAGLDAQRAYGDKYKSDNYFDKVIVEEWVDGIHARTLRRNGAKTGWTSEFDLETNLTVEIEELSKALKQKQDALNTILGEQDKESVGHDLLGDMAAAETNGNCVE